jgi:hypothetical protein
MSIFGRIWAGLKDRIVGGPYDGPVTIDVHPGPEPPQMTLEDSLYMQETIAHKGGKKVN